MAAPPPLSFLWPRGLNQNADRDQLKDNALLKKYYCDVDIGDLIKYNDELAHRMVSEPAEIIPLVSRRYIERPAGMATF